MANKPSEYWTILYIYNDKRYYIRKGYSCVFMDDIEFTEILSKKQISRIYNFIVDKLAAGGHHPIHLNHDVNNNVLETDITKFSLYRLTLS